VNGQVLSGTTAGALSWVTPLVLTGLSATAPLTYNNGTGAFTISQAATAADGYLSSADWNTFNNKLTSANNGLTVSSGNVALGGALTAANTTIATAAGNTLSITGLQAEAAYNDEVTITAAGVLTRRPPAIATKSGDYTATLNDETILVNATSAAVTITLPDATTATGKKFIVKKIDTTSNAVTVKATAGNIDGIAPATGIAGSLPWQGWVIQSDGTNWYVVGRI